MTGPYTIDQDHRDTLEEQIIAKLNCEDVTKPLKAKLNEMCQAAVDETTEYLKGEYPLIIEEIARDRAARLVVGLLKGNHELAQHFDLEKTIARWGPDAGKDCAYDRDGIRRAIVNAFKSEIQTAEIIALMEENELLRRDNEYLRKQVYR